ERNRVSKVGQGLKVGDESHHVVFLRHLGTGCYESSSRVPPASDGHPVAKGDEHRRAVRLNLQGEGLGQTARRFFRYGFELEHPVEVAQGYLPPGLRREYGTPGRLGSRVPQQPPMERSVRNRLPEE